MSYVKEDLLDHIQPFWAEVEEAVKLLDVDAAELTRIDAYITTVIDNFYVRSSDRSLARFEKALGIKPPLGATLEQRKKTVEARIRIQGAMTRDALINIAAGFGMKIEIYENFPGYVVEFDVVDEDAPIDERMFYETFRELVPAHVDINYRVKLVRNLALDTERFVNEIKTSYLGTTRLSSGVGGL